MWVALISINSINQGWCTLAGRVNSKEVSEREDIITKRDICKRESKRGGK